MATYDATKIIDAIQTPPFSCLPLLPARQRLLWLQHAVAAVVRIGAAVLSRSAVARSSDLRAFAPVYRWIVAALPAASVEVSKSAFAAVLLSAFLDRRATPILALSLHLDVILHSHNQR